MCIIVLLSPIHFFPLFPSLNYHLHYILNSEGGNVLTIVSTNNFKIDINGISDSLEICKNIISEYILIYQRIRSFIPCSPEVHYTWKGVVKDQSVYQRKLKRYSLSPNRSPTPTVQLVRYIPRNHRTSGLKPSLSRFLSDFLMKVSAVGFVPFSLLIIVSTMYM